MRHRRRGTGVFVDGLAIEIVSQWKRILLRPVGCSTQASHLNLDDTRWWIDFRRTSGHSGDLVDQSANRVNADANLVLALESEGVGRDEAGTG